RTDPARPPRPRMSASPCVDTAIRENDTFPGIGAPMRKAVRMITKRPLMAGVWGALVVVSMAAGWATAQGGAEPAAPRAETVPVNGAEQLARAERALAQGRASAQRIQGLMDESRRERDLIRMTCLSDKLAQY